MGKLCEFDKYLCIAFILILDALSKFIVQYLLISDCLPTLHLYGGEHIITICT